ncbi:O-antigen ligase family protein [Prochlorococcus sp. AH-716-D22]|nr:O-antigen ligase family protein [Prochlorococcus sp. AH-716-D22]
MVEASWNKLKKNKSNFIFYLGIFLLPSAFTISAFLLFIASVIGFKNRKEVFLKDKFNISFLISGLLMIISCIVQSINYKYSELLNWSPSLSWIGLANWLPFFLITWGFQSYLTTQDDRRNCALALLTGSVPVLFTGIGQVFFNWHGPLEILNGFIIWYSRPLDNNVLTGLFNNPNYTGAWLNIILPISFAFLIKKESSFRRIISLIFVLFIVLCIVLTNSRSAWIGLLASTLLFFGKRSFKWLIPLFISIAILILTSIFNNTMNLIPPEALNEFTNFQYLDRFDIWTRSVQIIIENPIFGSGASSFNEIYNNISGLNKYHSHNLALDLVISYGIPAALFTILPILFLMLLSIKKVSQIELTSNYIFERALITSVIIILLIHMVDIQYFDGRISIAIWILIAAIRNILQEDIYRKNRNNNKIKSNFESS